MCYYDISGECAPFGVTAYKATGHGRAMLAPTIHPGKGFCEKNPLRNHLRLRREKEDTIVFCVYLFIKTV